MNISIFELFSIGIGPSSSHTVGPMRAANEFVSTHSQLLAHTKRINVKLYGSLAYTGRGHNTDVAILNGLEGQRPETAIPELLRPRANEIISNKKINLNSAHEIAFNEAEDLEFLQGQALAKHSNGMEFILFDSNDNAISKQIYYSIGGGFIVTDEQFDQPFAEQTEVTYPFNTAQELVDHCEKSNLNISDIMLANELAWNDAKTVRRKILEIANIMEICINKGCQNEGILPGGLEVRRRAPELFRKLQKRGVLSTEEQSDIMNWLNVYAMAVNEENAAGGRIITAPTNGAAGIIPAVLQYYKNYHKGACEETVIQFLLTAGAIAILYKKGASISAAEVGCQGEVGVASSMAAAALTAALGGSVSQIETAAEISMEHHLGLTCDPIKGLVQIPCIERNAMGSVQAVNAARLSLLEDRKNKVSLDQVIATMLQTGQDMQSKYKETSLGGLAVGIPEC